MGYGGEVTREDWAELEVGDRPRDRGGREWTVAGPPYEHGREVRAVLRDGDYVLVESDWHAEDYVRVEG